MALTSTRTFTTYFDFDDVDRLVGGAHRELEAEYERRKQYIDKRAQHEIEARLQMLRAVWVLMLERAD